MIVGYALVAAATQMLWLTYAPITTNAADYYNVSEGAIGALSIIGSQLWKKANRLDPAKRSEPFRFFVQNQLGAIVAIIAFLPLIIVVLLNKDMSGTQKGIAGGIGAVVAIAAIALGVDYNPPSVEQYTADQSTVIQLLGEDSVVWVAGGSVYHVCADVPDVQGASTAGRPYRMIVEHHRSVYRFAARRWQGARRLLLVPAACFLSVRAAVDMVARALRSRPEAPRVSG